MGVLPCHMYIKKNSIAYLSQCRVLNLRNSHVAYNYHYHFESTVACPKALCRLSSFFLNGRVAPSDLRVEGHHTIVANEA